MSTIVIFGANGQDGYYLSNLYLKQGCKVIGVSRTGDWLRGDVSTFEFVEELIKDLKPDIIFHLAATSTTSHGALFQNHKTIGTGVLNILEAVHRWHPECRVFLAGSGLQFVNMGRPIHENDPFDASCAYAVERIHSVYAARYFRSIGLKVYVGYLFHHESPLRKSKHLSQIIVQAAKRIAAGSTEKLVIGDISVEKEWAFAGDIVAGMATLVEQDIIFEAVIGTGKTHKIEEWLKICFGYFGKDWSEHVKLQNEYHAEYKRLFSNPETISSLGWRPKLGFAELAELMLRH